MNFETESKKTQWSIDEWMKAVEAMPLERTSELLNAFNTLNTWDMFKGAVESFGMRLVRTLLESHVTALTNRAGQDRKSYSDTQDRDSYTLDEASSKMAAQIEAGKKNRASLDELPAHRSVGSINESDFVIYVKEELIPSLKKRSTQQRELTRYEAENLIEDFQIFVILLEKIRGTCLNCGHILSRTEHNYCDPCKGIDRSER